MTTSIKAIHLLAIGAFLASPILTSKLSPNTYDGGRSRDEFDRELRNSSAIANILGEVRTSLGDLMFIKTERYLHAGMAYQAHIDLDKAASTGEIADRSEGISGDFSFARDIADADDHDHDHDHEEAPTLIPRAEDDFRGFVGYLHRRVKPWQDPDAAHFHTSGKELLPWYRLMTLSDPQNVRAYLLGAWWLKTQRDDKVLAEALKFIDEGIVNNPRAFQLYTMRAELKGLIYGQEAAVEDYHLAAEYALAARPEGVDIESSQFRVTAGGIVWTYYMEEDARRAFRSSVLFERNYGSREKAIELGNRYMATIGEETDAVLRRIVRNLEMDQ